MVICTFGMIVFLCFFIFVLRLQWAKKLGWIFLAVGGRSSMREWPVDCNVGGPSPALSTLEWPQEEKKRGVEARTDFLWPNISRHSVNIFLQPASGRPDCLRFLSIPEILILQSTVMPCWLPSDHRNAIKLLGNSIAVPHAILAITNALGFRIGQHQRSSSNFQQVFTWHHGGTFFVLFRNWVSRPPFADCKDQLGPACLHRLKPINASTLGESWRNKSFSLLAWDYLRSPAKNVSFFEGYLRLAMYTRINEVKTPHPRFLMSGEPPLRPKNLTKWGSTDLHIYVNCGW